MGARPLLLALALVLCATLARSAGEGAAFGDTASTAVPGQDPFEVGNPTTTSTTADPWDPENAPDAVAHCPSPCAECPACNPSLTCPDACASPCAECPDVCPEIPPLVCDIDDVVCTAVTCNVTNCPDCSVVCPVPTCAKNSECNDDDPCTKDRCVFGFCQNTPKNSCLNDDDDDDDDDTTYAAFEGLEDEIAQRVAFTVNNSTIPGVVDGIWRRLTGGNGDGAGAAGAAGLSEALTRPVFGACANTQEILDAVRRLEHSQDRKLDALIGIASATLGVLVIAVLALALIAIARFARATPGML